MHDDRTLISPEFDVWRIIAMESGMSPEDVESVSKIRMRLIAAVMICHEIVGQAPPEVIGEVFKEVCSDAARHSPSQLEWPVTD